MLRLVSGCLTALSATASCASSIILEYNVGATYLTHIAALPGTQVGIPYYDEDGFRTKPFGELRTDPPFDLSLVGPDASNKASNGTAHLSLLRGDSLEVVRLNGRPFAALSVELAAYSTVFPVPKTIGFEGMFADGSSTSISFTTDGFVLGGNSLTDFETFTFPASFTGIIRLSATTDVFSLDDLVLRAVPEPTSALHLATGVVFGLGLCFCRFHRVSS